MYYITYRSSLFTVCPLEHPISFSHLLLTFLYFLGYYCSTSFVHFSNILLAGCPAYFDIFTVSIVAPYLCYKSHPRTQIIVISPRYFWHTAFHNSSSGLNFVLVHKLSSFIFAFLTQYFQCAPRVFLSSSSTWPFSPFYASFLNTILSICRLIYLLPYILTTKK